MQLPQIGQLSVAAFKQTASSSKSCSQDDAQLKLLCLQLLTAVLLL